MYKTQFWIALHNTEVESLTLTKYLDAKKDNTVKDTKTKRTFFTFFILL